MRYKRILVTGGAGFVGSHICLNLKESYPRLEIIALDNLNRRGAELNLPRLKSHGVIFRHGDVRNKEDLFFPNIELIIECSAEPSVMAGVDSSPEYSINTNLLGAINCFELARRVKAHIIFLSTSRVYPIQKINNLQFTEKKTRFQLEDNQKISGVSEEGINESFTLDGIRSIYGTTKLSSELILQEYIENYDIKGIINRCGVITGAWQMGKVDQGVIVLWMAKHIFEKELKYIGFGGEGKQVRDILHIDDLINLLKIQIREIDKFNREIFNVGGGKKNSISLLELTNYCQEITGNKLEIGSEKKTRSGDVRIYITDNSKIYQQTGWQPRKNIRETLVEIHRWIINYKKNLETILE